MSNKEVYEKVTAKIMEKLSKGIVPWKKSWSCNDVAVNWGTQKAYRGINALLLDAGEYATFNAVKAAGGRVNAGAKGHSVVFYQFIDKKDKDAEIDEEENSRFMFTKLYTVFEINTQCTGLTSKRKNQTIVNPIEECEKIVAGYKTIPSIVYGNPAYSPAMDCMYMPHMNEFGSVQEYYAALFHEMVHSTGSKKRLDRQGIASFDYFGSDQYSKEELIAETGAAMLCSMSGIETTMENSVAYLQNWMKKLADDPRLIVTAANMAQKACDYIINNEYKGE